ncbi:MAG TPA: DUF3105 domain-containing protein [Kofleriaceae bacterium]
MSRPIALVVPALSAALSLAACTDDPPASGKTQVAVGACNGMLTVEHNVTAPHVDTGTDITWSNNPPTSGPHFPTWAAWDRQYPTLDRGYYVHNAEHGGIMLLYRCDAGCPDVVDQLLAAARNMAADAMCTSPITKRVIVAPDPLLPDDVQVAAVAWNHAYTASCYDAYVETFARDNYAKAPENFCNEGANVSGGTPIGQ